MKKILLHAYSYEVNLIVRQETLARQLEVEDLTAASLVSATGDESIKSKASGKNVSVEKVRVGGAINLLVEKCRTNIKTNDAVLSDINGRLKTQFDGIGSMNPHITQAQADLTRAHTTATQFYDKTIDKLLLLVTNLAQYENATAVSAQKTEADRLMKLVAAPKGEVKTFVQAKKEFVKMLDNQARDAKMQVAGNAMDKADVRESPFYTIIKTKYGNADEKVNCTSSFFEAKSGSRAALLSPNPLTDPLATLLNNAKVRKGLKDMQKHLLTNSTGISKLPDPAVQRKLKKDLSVAFDANMFSQLPLPPNQDWTAQVFEYQIFGSQDKHISVNFPHMCLMEARVLLEGEEIIVGIPYTNIPGENLKAKRAGLFSMPMDTIADLVSTTGFAFRHDSTQLALLPTGFVIIIASVGGGTAGLRWSVSSDDACVNRTKSQLQVLLESFPELGNASTGYCQWKAWLNAM